MTLVSLLPLILLALGVGFFIANVRLALELWRWRQRRPDGLVTWPAKRPPYFGLSLGLGMVLGLLVLLKAYLTWRQSAQLLLSLQLLAQSTGGLQVYPILPNATQVLFWLLTFALSHLRRADDVRLLRVCCRSRSASTAVYAATVSGPTAGF